MTSSKERGMVQQAFWGQGPLCTCFFSLSKPFASSHKFSELQHYGGDTHGDFSETGASRAGLDRLAHGLHSAEPGTVKQMTEWNPAGNGFFWFVCIFLHTVSLSVNACVPYTVRKTRISQFSFIPHSIFHSLIMSFIDFLLKIGTHNPFKFCIYTTSKHFSEFFSIFIFQLPGAGVRHGSSTARSKDVQHPCSSPCCNYWSLGKLSLKHQITLLWCPAV